MGFWEDVPFLHTPEEQWFTWFRALEGWATVVGMVRRRRMVRGARFSPIVDVFGVWRVGGEVVWVDLEIVG
jgi:hypothetical protein